MPATTVTRSRAYWFNFQKCSLSREKDSPKLKIEVHISPMFLNINLLKETDLKLFPAKLTYHTYVFPFVKCPLSWQCMPAGERGISQQQ